MSTTSGLPNLVTIVGGGSPSSYEITVDGSIELVGADPLEDVTVVTDHGAEGAVDAGVMRFRFSGRTANVCLSERNGVAESMTAPDVLIEYDVPPERDGR